MGRTAEPGKSSEGGDAARQVVEVVALEPDRLVTELLDRRHRLGRRGRRRDAAREHDRRGHERDGERRDFRMPPLSAPAVTVR